MNKRLERLKERITELMQNQADNVDVGLILIITTPDGNHKTIEAPGKQIARLILELDIVKAEMIQNIIKERDYNDG